MKNLMQSAKDQAVSLVLQAYRAAVEDGTLPHAEIPGVPVEIPRDAANEIGRASCRERV